MRTHVSKWGNSFAVRLPHTVVKDLRLREGTILELKSDQSGITLRKTQKRISLQELLKGITPENCHGEVEWGQSTGNESW
ncbi:MAG: AbrB/MazE/SpoVT family DNA-binding domain-containing protein [Planctomycetia bacterium]|nr:AbrB/MazE/SpoVT family DNA-binding domain-containing protein [Planctomycetia bacterium]